MSPRETLLHLLTFVAAFLVHAASGRSWDIAVVIGREVNFFARNQSLTGQAVIAEAAALTAITYDDITRTMYFTDTEGSVSIFTSDLTEKNLTVHPLLTKENGSQVSGIAFDSSSRTLFWSDALKRTIMKMRLPLNALPEDPVVVHRFANQTPRFIALDACNRYIYWVNSDKTSPSIERSKMDGSNRSTVISDDLYNVMGLAVDHEEAKIYWADDKEGIHFKIERSNLDGTSRELLVQSKHQQPYYMAVDRESVYWTDLVHSAIWMIKKDAQHGDYPVKIKSYFESNRDADPSGIIARDNIGTIDCTALPRSDKRTGALKKVIPTMIVRSFNNLTTSTEESDLTTESSRYCLNGHLDETDGTTCRCKPGFTGTLCETSLCHNYCLKGRCAINNLGAPECECRGTFGGERCEKNLCDDYCLNDGECYLRNGWPTCKCKYSKGVRCELSHSFADVCAIFCTSDQSDLPNVDTTSCKCTEANHTAERIVSFGDSIDYNTLLPTLAALIVVLVLLIAALSYYVNKLRRRPRIKKRFVVGKGVTPLTSRPQIPDSQCEITIENCCNMNICETPCFEPKLRGPVPRSNGARKEEKNSLLDNMEGNAC